MGAELYSQNCPDCGIRFGFPSEMEKVWRGSHKSFYCPNGHSLSWQGETPEQKELRELRAEVTNLKTKLESAQTKADAQEKKVAELTAELEIWRPSSATDKADSNGSEQVRTGD